MIFPHIFIYKDDITPIKISAGVFENVQVGSKKNMEIQETNIAKAILEKYTVFECTLLDLKTYIKVKVVQRIGIDTRINK